MVSRFRPQRIGELSNTGGAPPEGRTGQIVKNGEMEGRLFRNLMERDQRERG
jgi:hypothetical protein